MATLPASVHHTAHHRADLRRWQRIPVALQGTIISSRGPRNVRVHNLGPGGALVEVAMPLQPGSEVVFECGAIKAEGMVLWQRPQRCGIWFYEPLSEAMLAKEFARSGTAYQPRAQRPQTRQAWRPVHRASDGPTLN